MSAVLSGFEKSVIEAATKHDDNWEAVAFEVDRDPELVQTVAQAAREKLAAGNGTAASAPAAKASTAAVRQCADPECDETFSPASGRQKYCKGQDCQRRRWAREKRSDSSKPRQLSTAAAPPSKPAPAAPPDATPAPATVRQDPPSGAIADRYLEQLLARALEDLTPEQARAELERLTHIGSPA